MKKLLGILVLGLFWTSLAIAIELSCVNEEDTSSKFKVYKKKENTWCMKSLLADEICLHNPEDSSTLMLFYSILPGEFNKEGFKVLNQDQYEWHEYVYIDRFNGKFQIKGVNLENGNEWEYFGTCKSKKRKF